MSNLMGDLGYVYWIGVLLILDAVLVQFSEHFGVGISVKKETEFSIINSVSLGTCPWGRVHQSNANK